MLEEIVKNCICLAHERAIRVNPDMMRQYVTFCLGGGRRTRIPDEKRLVRIVRRYNESFNRSFETSLVTQTQPSTEIYHGIVATCVA